MYKKTQIMLTVEYGPSSRVVTVIYSIALSFISYWTPHSSQTDHFNSFDRALDGNRISCISYSLCGVIKCSCVIQD